MKSLIEAGVNVNGRDIRGYTPLFYVTKTGYIISAEVLLDYKTDINAINNDRDIPLYESLREYVDDVL